MWTDHSPASSIPRTPEHPPGIKIWVDVWLRNSVLELWKPMLYSTKYWLSVDFVPALRLAGWKQGCRYRSELKDV